MKRFFNQYLKPIESNDDWFERFQENWNTAMAAGGENSLIPKISQTSNKYNGKSDEEIKEATKAMYIFLQLDRIRYGNKIREILENVVLGHDNFPVTTNGAYRILADTQRRLDEERLRTGNSNTWIRNIGS